jgi:hypothetical protein
VQLHQDLNQIIDVVGFSTDNSKTLSQKTENPSNIADARVWIGGGL